MLRPILASIALAACAPTLPRGAISYDRLPSGLEVERWHLAAPQPADAERWVDEAAAWWRQHGGEPSASARAVDIVVFDRRWPIVSTGGGPEPVPWPATPEECRARKLSCFGALTIGGYLLIGAAPDRERVAALVRHEAGHAILSALGRSDSQTAQHSLMRERGYPW